MSHFWSHTTAAPSLWHLSYFTSHNPRFLRTEAPPLISDNWNTTAHIIQLHVSDSHRVAQFMNVYYGENEWRLESPNSWISSYLSDPNVHCLGLIDNTTHEILATIFSTSFSGKTTRMSHSIAMYENVRVIEGLCVHASLRKKGVAGFMIQHMDCFTHSLYGPTIHLWSRELHTIPLIHTALSIDVYGYKLCKADAVASAAVQTIPFNDFVIMWKLNCNFWYNDQAIIACIPQNRRGGIRIYRYEDFIVGITKTRRHTNNVSIYEIVWCGKIMNGRLYPATHYYDFKDALTAISCHSDLNDVVLFGTSSPTGGGISSEWSSDGWVYGCSGAHAWYIYNYMPPSFHNCRIYNVREEL